jgi:hypothetical protein
MINIRIFSHFFAKSVAGLENLPTFAPETI